MIRFDRVNRIHLYSGPTSMKMGIRKIQQAIAFSFSPAEMLNSVFVFCSKSRKCVKAYYEDEYGFWLLQNRITAGDFKWPDAGGDGRITVDRRQAHCQAVLNHQDGHNQRARLGRYLEHALENVGRKPLEAILPYSKDLEIR